MKSDERELEPDECEVNLLEPDFDIKKETIDLFAAKIDMESFISLLGNDQATILNSLQTLAGNGEIVKAQKEEINNLYDALDKLKDENHTLTNKLDVKRDIIDDLENVLDKKDDEVKQVKEDLAIKDKEFDTLEKFVNERIIEINYLRENNTSLAKQVGEAIQLENKSEIQTKVIKELKDQRLEKSVELSEILKDIEKLQNENIEKELLLKNVSTEKQNLEEKLKISEVKQQQLEELKASNVEVLENIAEKNEEQNETLSEELDNIDLVNPFHCELCNNKFGTRSTLRAHIRNMHEENAMQHWMMKYLQAEKEISKIKFNILSKIHILKENESKYKISCRCRGWCGINHMKHG